MPLLPADAAALYAAALYASGLSACQIAEQHGLTRTGVEDKIRKGGLRGNVWCPIHRRYEVLN